MHWLPLMWMVRFFIFIHKDLFFHKYLRSSKGEIHLKSCKQHHGNQCVLRSYKQSRSCNHRQKNLTYLGLTVSWSSNRIFDRPINGWEISDSVFGRTRCTRLYFLGIVKTYFFLFKKNFFGQSRNFFDWRRTFSIGVGLFLAGGGLFLSPTVTEKSPPPTRKSPTAIPKRCWTLEYSGKLEFSSPFMEQWTLDARGVLNGIRFPGCGAWGTK